VGHTECTKEKVHSTQELSLHYRGKILSWKRSDTGIGKWELGMVTQALRRLRQDDFEFLENLDYLLRP
jgi:hypothetical protein